MSTAAPPQVTYSALLGRVLQHYREARGLSQAQVAQQLGMMQPSYSRIEQGGTAITVLQLRRIATAVGVDVATILNHVENWVGTLTQQKIVVVESQDVPKEAVVAGLALVAGVLALASLAASS
jgi:transcriptional regulator with XRE-family HTH domain